MQEIKLEKYVRELVVVVDCGFTSHSAIFQLCRELVYCACDLVKRKIEVPRDVRNSKGP